MAERSRCQNAVYRRCSPWENGYVESFNGTLLDELLKREIFLSFEGACWVIDRWRLDYNHHRIHSLLDYQTPAAYVAGCVHPASATAQPPEHSRNTNPNPLTQLSAKAGGEAVVSLHPVLNNDTCFLHSPKLLTGQTLISETAVEALNETVLPRTA